MVIGLQRLSTFFALSSIFFFVLDAARAENYDAEYQVKEVIEVRAKLWDPKAQYPALAQSYLVNTIPVLEGICTTFRYTGWGPALSLPLQNEAWIISEVDRAVSGYKEYEKQLDDPNSLHRRRFDSAQTACKQSKDTESFPCKQVLEMQLSRPRLYIPPLYEIVDDPGKSNCEPKSFTRVYRLVAPALPDKHYRTDKRIVSIKLGVLGKMRFFDPLGEYENDIILKVVPIEISD